MALLAMARYSWVRPRLSCQEHTAEEDEKSYGNTKTTLRKFYNFALGEQAPAALEASSKRSRGNCGLPSACAGCGSSRASGRKPARSWYRSMAGAPRALT